MSIEARRLLQAVLGAVAAVTLLVTPTVFLDTQAERSRPVAQCYDGVIPWNPYLQSCSLPSTQPRVRGAAPGAGAIIACRHHPGCLAWYVNGGP